jgi:hypothetical protein
MLKLTLTIWAIIFICLNSHKIKAQAISLNEIARRELNNFNAISFKVSIVEADKDLLDFKVKINNPTQDSIRVYLRNRNGYNFLEEKTIKNEKKIAMTLHFSMLEDGEYTFVIRSPNNFFSKQFKVESGDLTNTRINGKDVTTINKKVEILDE